MRRRILWGGLLFFTAALQLCARYLSGFAEGYATKIYPFLLRTVGGATALAPFSVGELCIYLLLGGVVVYVLHGIRSIRGKVISPRRWLGLSLCRLAKAGILWFFLFTMGCGINYHRTPFSQLAGLDTEASAAEELEGLCLWLTGRIQEAAGEIALQENGLCALPDEMLRKTREAMEQLGEIYPELSGWYPPAKPVFSWPVLSLCSLEGVSGPYTMEANYNPNIPAYNQPAVICHELSHLKGFMREDEANYIAYLACTAAEDANLRYSGLLLAYTHSINALYRADYERFVRVRTLLCEQAERDYAYHREYWEQYDGTIADVSDRVNDAYLKANAQEDGSDSYGRMVDLLLGEYRREAANIQEEEMEYE